MAWSCVLNGQLFIHYSCILPWSISNNLDDADNEKVTTMSKEGSQQCKGARLFFLFIFYLAKKNETVVPLKKYSGISIRFNQQYIFVTMLCRDDVIL